MEERIFCGEGKCSNKCPAYDGSDYDTWCRIVKAKLKAEKAKEKAYEKMEKYWENI